MEAARLRRNQDFTRLYRKGRATRVGVLLIRTVPNHTPITRVAVVVSKKVAKSAVRRNRLRRQINEVWRGQAERLRPGLDVVITVTADREHTPAEITAALDRAAILS